MSITLFRVGMRSELAQRNAELDGGGETYRSGKYPDQEVQNCGWETDRILGQGRSKHRDQAEMWIGRLVTLMQVPKTQPISKDASCVESTPWACRKISV